MPSPIYTEPKFLVPALWKAYDPGHIRFLSTAVVPVAESFWTHQLPWGGRSAEMSSRKFGWKMISSFSSPSFLSLLYTLRK